jgi:hypothetical protein
MFDSIKLCGRQDWLGPAAKKEDHTATFFLFMCGTMSVLAVDESFCVLEREGFTRQSQNPVISGAWRLREAFSIFISSQLKQFECSTAIAIASVGIFF